MTKEYLKVFFAKPYWTGNAWSASITTYHSKGYDYVANIPIPEDIVKELKVDSVEKYEEVSNT